MSRSSVFRPVCCLVLLLALVSAPAVAQDAAQAAAQQPIQQETVVQAQPAAAVAPAPAAAGSPAALAAALATVPMVVKVRSDQEGRPNVAGLDDRVDLEVERLGDALAALAGGCKDLVLFLDGLPIAGAAPLSCNPTSGIVRYHLLRTDDSDQAWHTLLGRPDGFRRPVQVSIGPHSDLSWPSSVREFELELIPELPFLLFLAVMLCGLVVFVHLARSTAILRDPHANPSPGKLAPYSLARFQLGFWFFLVVVSYVFVWLITDELDSITGSVLALLGIGSGTALGASLIDSGKAQAGNQEAAGTSPAPAAPPPAAVPAAPQDSRGFLKDLLQDAQGVSLYRFQMFVWTLVLGIIFLASVYDKLAMPQFSATLLGLMGISSGTFLGAKFPEQ